MMLSDWTAKWQMKLNADASNVYTQRKTTLILHTQNDSLNYL